MGRIIMPLPEARLHQAAAAPQRRQGQQTHPIDFEALCSTGDVQVPELEEELQQQQDVPVEPDPQGAQRQATGLDLLVLWPVHQAFLSPPATQAKRIAQEQPSHDALTSHADLPEAQMTLRRDAVELLPSDPRIAERGGTSDGKTRSLQVDAHEHDAPAKSDLRPPSTRWQGAQPHAAEPFKETPPEPALAPVKVETSGLSAIPDDHRSTPVASGAGLALASSPLPPARQLLSVLEAPASPLRSLPSLTGEALHAGGEIRVLRMKLKPEALGDVDVILRRQGDEMRIQIVVDRPATANVLTTDLGLLRDRVGSLLGPDTAHSITIVVQGADNQPPALATARAEGADAGLLGGGNSTFREGERPPPRKPDMRSAFDQDDGQETTALRTSSVGLVV